MVEVSLTNHNELAIAQQLDMMSDWFKFGIGAEVLEQEKKCFLQDIKSIRPRYLLQLGGPEYIDFPIKEQYYVHIDPRQDFTTVGYNVCACFTQLPIHNACMDVVLCAHVHEFYLSQDDLFQEVWRVLKPEGKLLLFGFNTCSLWGLQRLMGQKGIVDWNKAFYTTRVTTRMLREYGFEVERLTTHCFMPYTTRSWMRKANGVMNHLGGHLWPFVGAVYCAVLVKRQPGVIPDNLAASLSLQG